ncbi:hypothetical protein JJD41_20595 [Oxynema sp. CENA135]|uniref:hypothetical protein n=1 Tax=Oxynema sp. CENA135 TaxID=984206 RepID=UPI00190CCF78|nr:hypothetical protein [Oxynema sp. CENA135]MBK4732247.1 hypothetical protein [Oxynema sp. CENA135]
MQRAHLERAFCSMAIAVRANRRLSLPTFDESKYKAYAPSRRPPQNSADWLWPDCDWASVRI